MTAAGVLDHLKAVLPLDLRITGQDESCFTVAAGNFPVTPETGKNEARYYFRFHRLPRSLAEEEKILSREDIYISRADAGTAIGTDGQAEKPCREEVRCVHIWEDQWERQREIVLGRMAALLGLATRVHGRSTEVRRTDRESGMRFFREHHLQTVLAGKYRFGLYQGEKLLSLAAFSGARRMAGGRGRSFELLRFCHAGPLVVVGGLSKLLAAFAGSFRPDDIMTYADREWSEGQAFTKLGFLPAGQTSPQVFWVRPGEYIRYYPHRLPPGLEDASPERLRQAGYFRICNSGSLKLILPFGKKEKKEGS